jgi:hypothetical protein
MRLKAGEQVLQPFFRKKKGEIGASDDSGFSKDLQWIKIGFPGESIQVFFDASSTMQKRCRFYLDRNGSSRQSSLPYQIQNTTSCSIFPSFSVDETGSLGYGNHGPATANALPSARHSCCQGPFFLRWEWIGSTMNLQGHRCVGYAENPFYQYFVTKIVIPGVTKIVILFFLVRTTPDNRFFLDSPGLSQCLDL